MVSDGYYEYLVHRIWSIQRPGKDHCASTDRRGEPPLLLPAVLHPRSSLSFAKSLGFSADPKNAIEKSDSELLREVDPVDLIKVPDALALNFRARFLSFLAPVWNGSGICGPISNFDQCASKVIQNCDRSPVLTTQW
jgi:hypothetical protein